MRKKRKKKPSTMEKYFNRMDKEKSEKELNVEKLENNNNEQNNKSENNS